MQINKFYLTTLIRGDILYNMIQITEKEFIEYYKKFSVAEMAKLLDCNRLTIYRWARKLDLPLKNPPLIKYEKT